MGESGLGHLDVLPVELVDPVTVGSEEYVDSGLDLEVVAYRSGYPDSRNAVEYSL